MKDFCGNLAAVLGGLAKFVLRLLVDRAQAGTAARLVAEAAVTAAQGVVIPRLQLLGEVTNLT